MAGGVQTPLINHVYCILYIWCNIARGGRADYNQPTDQLSTIINTFGQYNYHYDHYHVMCETL